VRLSKYLARMGVASRRKSEEIIAAGRVKVNGQTIVEQGVKIAPGNDRIEVDEQIINEVEKVYILLYKPRGYISSVYDPQGRATVIDLLQDVKKRVYPVGRLDFDTEGLLILSNDGDFANLMMHPRYEMKKKYEAWVKGNVKASELHSLEKGILLDDGMTSPAIVRILGKNNARTLVEIEIHEGRKRQVKRMCAAIGHPVLSLKRTAISFLSLEDLQAGEYRYLNIDEIKKLRQIAESAPNRS